MDFRTIVATIALLCAAQAVGLSQDRAITGNGLDSGGINVQPKDPLKKTTKTVRTIEFIAVSPERLWKSSEPSRKPVKGSLLAFAREKKTGKVSIVQDGNVRLLIGKKDFTFALSKLSTDDQSYVRSLVDSARAAGKLMETSPAKKAESSHVSKEEEARKKPAGNGANKD